MTRRSNTYDNETGARVKRPTPRKQTRPIGDTSTDFVDFGLTPGAAASGWDDSSAGASTDVETGSTVQGPSLGPLPTVTVTATPVTSGGLPWYFWAAVGLAAGYFVAKTWGGHIQRGLKVLAT